MKALITQNQLINFSGSEIVTLELAEAFNSYGYEVTILTNIFEQPIKEQFKALKNTKVINFSQKQALKLDANNFDVVWIHHNLLPEQMIRQLSKPKDLNKKPIVIYNHMSTVHPLEWPINITIEKAFADLMLFVSKEAEDFYNKKGLKLGNAVEIFANPAPSEFKPISKSSKPADKKTYTIVSNHPPDEMLQALRRLEHDGHEVNYIGRFSGAVPKRVTAEVIQSSDVVISIGKTVQYSLTCNVPIYCYDKFGGPGFLDEENYNKAEYHNFSGRGGFSPKDSGLIYKQLSEGASSDRNNKPEDLMTNKFSLPIRLRQVIDKAKSNRDAATPETIDSALTEPYINVINYRSSQYHNHELLKIRIDEQLKNIANLKKNIIKKDIEIDEANGAIKRRTTELNQIKGSLLWKITIPLRYLYISARRVAGKLYSPISTLRKKFLYKTLEKKHIVVDWPYDNSSYSSISKSLTEMNRVKVNWGDIKDSHIKKKFEKKLSIIVLSYNNLDLTVKCLDSINKSRTDIDYELIVVDNGSSTKTVHGLLSYSDRYPDIKMIFNKYNMNFAFGNNIGYSYSRGEYCIFLNNDTYVTDYWSDRLVEVLDKNKKIKLVQPLLLYPDENVQCLGVVFSSKSVLGYSLYADMSSKNTSIIKSRRLSAITAACMAVRSKDFAGLEGFDPVYVNGQEDVDLCLRASDSNDKVCYCDTSSVVYHDESKAPGRGRYVKDNRSTFKGRWSGKIIPDDESVYFEDGYHVDSWINDGDGSEKSPELTGLYKPILSRRLNK